MDWWSLVQGAVGAMLVVVADVGREDSVEVASVDDQRHSRRTVPIHRSMNALARGARTGVRIVRMASVRNTSSNAAVNLLSRSWIKNRIGSARSTKSHATIPLAWACRNCRHGCVELPLLTAANLWPYTPIGTLVTIEDSR